MRGFLSGLASLVLIASGTQVHASEQCPPYESIGEGPDLVLVPGLGSGPEVWDGIKDTLSEDYTLHLVHVAGFAGRPMSGDPQTIVDDAASEIIAYLDCKNIDSAAYAGHSMGGFLGLQLASEHPERIANLIVVDALPFFPLIFSPAATPELATPQANIMRMQMLEQNDAEFEQSQRMGVRSLVKNTDFHETVVGWSTSSDRASFAGAMHALMTTDLRPRLAEIDTPTTVIIAANAFAPRERVEPLYSAAYEGLEGLQLTIVEDSYHFIMFDQPQAFAAAMQRALNDGS